MADWLSSMQQTFEYYIVDPKTWRDSKRIDSVVSCTINRDFKAETLGSATIDTTEPLGECYVRAYLITIQNGITEKHPLGTVLIQTPSYSFDGKVTTVSMDAYTPLLELKENPTPIGYFLSKDMNIMDMAYQIVRDRARAPVVKTTCTDTLHNNFVANTDDTWLTFVSDLIANAKYIFDLDEMGRILFSPKQDTASLQPIWTFDDSNSSILYPEVTVTQDLYGIPNVVEVVYSNGTDYYFARVVNNDSGSPTSTVNRGREILYRDTDPALAGNPTESQIKEYAVQLLSQLSSVESSISFSHGYCPVRAGDCVRINYERAGLKGIKARIISQSIKCTPGCQVTSKATYITKLWR